MMMNQPHDQDAYEADVRDARKMAEQAEDVHTRPLPLVLCDFTSTCHFSAVNKIEMPYGWIIVCDEHLAETEEMRDGQGRPRS